MTQITSFVPQEWGEIRPGFAEPVTCWCGKGVYPRKSQAEHHGGRAYPACSGPGWHRTTNYEGQTFGGWLERREWA